MIPVILSGGSGTRLWPVSRVKLPKQFCTLFDVSLQTMSLKRASQLGSPIILTSKELKTLTEQNIKVFFSSTNEKKKIDPIYEPIAKNTAPAIAYLCKYLQLNQKEKDVVAILPSDQLIENESVFLESIQVAEKYALQGSTITLGITPHFPATGYGYIEIDKDSSAKQDQKTIQAYQVSGFVEKPNLEKANEYLKSEKFLWNAGIFVFQVEKMIEHFKNLAPEVWSVVDKLNKDQSNLDEIYSQFPNISIDYAIMEKLGSDNLKCIPCNMGWSDVGSWDAVSDLFKETEPDFVPIELFCKNNFIHGLKKKVYACIGLEDTIIVDTADALLLTKKGLSQNVKDVVEALKKKNHRAILEHTFEDRPWGRYEVLKETENFKSKVIHVQPGQQLSYQSHIHRVEHWIITQGHGHVILDEKQIPIERGSYVNVPKNSKHRIKNTGNDVLEFVEVQMGEYLGEDDIKRYQDDYKRE